MVNKRFAILIAAFVLVAIRLFAHEDPSGDIYPSVRVEKGNFAVYFSNNTSPREVDQESPLFRVVYSPNGELLAPRHPVKAIPNGEREVFRDDLTAIVGDERLEFAPYPRLFHDKPYYTIETKAGVERHRLPWPDMVKVSDLHSVVADESTITIAAKAGTDELSLYHFRRDRFELPQVVAIGAPLKIYDFPTASNLVFAGGKYWIAWMRGGENGKEAEAVLSSWSPGDKAAAKVMLEGPGDWNSHLSMAVSGNVLCVAYHCETAGGVSKIFTSFREVK